MTFLLFGTGDYYNRYRKWFEKEKVAALLDNAPEKQNTCIDGIRVLAPGEGVRISYDAIVILSFYYISMKQQLLELGVEEEKIYHFYDLHKLLRIQSYDPPDAVRDAEKGVLLLSQDLTLGGPSIALFHAARIMKKHGYSVLYASMLEGPLRGQIEEAEIPVVVDENLQIGTMQDCSWTQEFALVICNTINFHVFLSKRAIDTPVIWWLHDALFYYDGIDKELLRRIDRRNLQVVSVGPVPKEAVQTYVPDLEVGQLLYGVEDICRDRRKHTPVGKMKFVTIGYVTEHKGQDILLQAVRMLPKGYEKQAVFYIVGQDSTWMAQQLKQETSNQDHVIFTGTVDRERIDRILSEADVLVCPSRQDAMPTVAAEAMMHGVPCILSDVTGTVKYIHNGMDGIVFHSEDVEQLREKLVWCIENPLKAADMGILARKVYEEVFSMEAFEESILRIMLAL